MRITLYFLVLTSFIFSCSDDEPSVTEECDDSITLSQNIQPIVEQNCAIAGCHLDSQAPLFTDSDDIIANANRIKARTSAGTMPPSGAISSTLVSEIACWVDNGAIDN